MRKKQSGLKFTSKYVVICGNVLIAIGVIAIAFDWAYSDRFSELGYRIIIATNIIVSAIGGCVAIVGNALLAIEARIQRIENGPQ